MLGEQLDRAGQGDPDGHGPESPEVLEVQACHRQDAQGRQGRRQEEPPIDGALTVLGVRARRDRDDPNDGRDDAHHHHEEREHDPPHRSL